MKKLRSENEINADLRKMIEELRRLRDETKNHAGQRTVRKGKHHGNADERFRLRASKKR
jgi:hypothetical protein